MKPQKEPIGIFKALHELSCESCLYMIEHEDEDKWADPIACPTCGRTKKEMIRLEKTYWDNPMHGFIKNKTGTVYWNHPMYGMKKDISGETMKKLISDEEYEGAIELLTAGGLTDIKYFPDTDTFAGNKDGKYYRNIKYSPCKK